MTKFSEIAHHYLGTGLTVSLHGKQYELLGIEPKGFLLSGGFASWGPETKPHFRSFHKLTQLIRVEGEEPFVPIDELEALFELDHQHYWDPAQGMEGTSLTAENILEEPFFIVQQLLDWGFNCFGLPEGEFIEIED